MTLKTRILVTLVFAAALGHGEVLFTTNDAPARVEGVAVWHRPTDQYYYLLDDAGGAWRIRNADGRVLIRPGDRVRVEGVKPRGSARPRIERATTEKIGTGSLPEPVEMTVDEMYAVGDDGEAGRRAWYARLVAAIRLAAQDGGFIADDFDEPKVGPLSRREIEVLTYIAQGKTHEEIGMIGDISAETVRTHMKSIFRKLDCTNAPAAVSRAYELGILRA